MDHVFKHSIYYKFRHSPLISRFINIRTSQKLSVMYFCNLLQLAINRELTNTSLFHIISLLFNAFSLVYHKFGFVPSETNIFGCTVSICWWEIDYLKKEGQSYSDPRPQTSDFEMFQLHEQQQIVDFLWTNIWKTRW